MESVAEHLAQEIKERYVTGTDIWRLPSERALALEMGVNRQTLRKGLQLLMDQGVIVQPVNGRIRRIIRPTNTAPAPQATRAEPPSWTVQSAPTSDDPMENYLIDTSHVETRLGIRLVINDLCTGTAPSVSERWARWSKTFSREHAGVELQFLPYQSTWWMAEPNFDLLECLISNRSIGSGVAAIIEPKLMGDHRLNRERFDLHLWSEAVTPEGLSCVPFGCSVDCLVMRVEDWRTFGLATIPTSWTWEEFLPIAERYTRLTAQPAIMRVSDQPVLPSLGMDVTQADGAPQADPNSEKLLRRILAVSQAVSGDDAMIERVLEGKHLARVSLSSVVPKLNDMWPDRLVILPMPCQPTGWIHRHTQGLYLAREAKCPVDSIDLIAFLCDDPQQRDLARHGHLIPAVTAVHDQFGADASGVPGVPNLLNSLSRARPLPLPASHLAMIFHQVVRRELPAFVQGRQSFASMMQRITLRIQSLPIHATPR